MKISKGDIEKMDRIKRLNLVNNLSGYKAANLIGTRDINGISNLAIVSSVIHLSSSPAVIGFMQRSTTVARHTYSNILATGVFTINHVHQGFMDKAHYTSAKFDETESEFEKCGLMEDRHVDMNQLETVCISGLNHYHQVNQITTFGYARPGEFPLNSYSKA